VLRAPAITPRDEEMRPSGTLQSPTTGSLEAMIREADRDEQIAAARMLPKTAVIQLPDAPLPKTVQPATISQTAVNTSAPVPVNNNPVSGNSTVAAAPAANNQTAVNANVPVPVNNNEASGNSTVAAAPAANNQTAAAPPTTNGTSTTVPATNNQPAAAPPTTNLRATGTSTTVPATNKQTTGNANVAAAKPAVENNSSATTEDLPSYVPAPRSLVSDRAAAQVATVNATTAGTQNAVLTSLPTPVDSSLNVKSGTTRVAQISFLPTDDVLKLGEKRRYAIQMSSDVSLSLALFALRFDPKVVKVSSLSAGSLLGIEQAPALTQSIDPHGLCLISFSGLNGSDAS